MRPWERRIRLEMQSGDNIFKLTITFTNTIIEEKDGVDYNSDI